MTTYQSSGNGQLVHYYASGSEPCHPAIIAGNYVYETGPVSADVIQLDAVSLGVVVPVRRNGVDFDGTISTDNTLHTLCSRT